MGKKTGYDRSAVKKLDAIDWSEIMPDLIKYAWNKEKAFSYVEFEIVCIDVVKEAIARVYGHGKNGKYRNWDYEKYPDPVKFLKFVINEIIREEIRRLTGYSTEQLHWKNEPGEERPLAVADEADAHQYSTPDDLMLEEEENKIKTEFIEAFSTTIEEISKEDEELESLILCIYDEKIKNREIAEATGIEKNKINNLKKRLKRRLKLFRNQYN